MFPYFVKLITHSWTFFLNILFKRILYIHWPYICKHPNIYIFNLYASSLSPAIYFQEEIIPENYRLKVAEEEKAKEMEDLYLPPRSRKTLQQINQSESDGKNFCLIQKFIWSIVVSGYCVGFVSSAQLEFFFILSSLREYFFVL